MKSTSFSRFETLEKCSKNGRETSSLGNLVGKPWERDSALHFFDKNPRETRSCDHRKLAQLRYTWKAFFPTFLHHRERGTVGFIFYTYSYFCFFSYSILIIT